MGSGGGSKNWGKRDSKSAGISNFKLDLHKDYVISIQTMAKRKNKINILRYHVIEKAYELLCNPKLSEYGYKNHDSE